MNICYSKIARTMQAAAGSCGHLQERCPWKEGSPSSCMIPQI